MQITPVAKNKVPIAIDRYGPVDKKKRPHPKKGWPSCTEVSVLDLREIVLYCGGLPGPTRPRIWNNHKMARHTRETKDPL